MKQKLGLIVGFIIFAALIAVSLIHDANADAAQSPETAIRNTVQAYLEAVNAGDIDAMVEITDDLRFPDKATQKQSYAGLKESVTNISIQGLEPLSPTSYKVNILATIQGNQQQIALQVVNKYDKWLVVIGQQQQQ